MIEKLRVLKYLTDELINSIAINARRKATEELEDEENKGKEWKDRKYTYCNMPRVSKAKLKRLRLSINELLREIEQMEQ